MHIPHSLVFLTFLSLSAAHKGRNSSSLRSRSITASARLPTAIESLSPALSTLPPNAAAKVAVPPIASSDTVPLLPRGKVEDVDFESLHERQDVVDIPSIDSVLTRDPDSVNDDYADISYIRQATAASLKASKRHNSSKPAKIESGGRENGTDTSARKSKAAKSKPAKTTAAPAVEARDLEDVAGFLYIRQEIASSKAAKKTKAPKAGCSKGNGTDNAVPKSKSPNSKAAKTTGNANLPTAQAVPIPTDAPTIPFPTGGAMLPLIPTQRASRMRSGSLKPTSTAVSTTLVRRVRDRGVEMAGWF
ncbi:hypothetical protein IFR05_005739 [Cadophora sp. M221]|nr:hypothetical protein IFR05_005739 [Cadophora sp. M221]